MKIFILSLLEKGFSFYCGFDGGTFCENWVEQEKWKISRDWSTDFDHFVKTKFEKNEDERILKLPNVELVAETNYCFEFFYRSWSKSGYASVKFTESFLGFEKTAWRETLTEKKNGSLFEFLCLERIFQNCR